MKRRAALLAAALASAPAAAQAEEGGKLFQARCGECHSVEKLAPSLARRAPAAREKYLERFLQRHYAPDAAERQRIVAWLGAQVGAGR